MTTALHGAEHPAADRRYPNGAQNKPDFPVLHPNGRVPPLEVDDGSTLRDSNAPQNAAV